jgi:hypothetical protein
VGVLEAAERRASRRRYRGLLSPGGWADTGLAGGGGTGGRPTLCVRRWEKVEVGLVRVVVERIGAELRLTFSSTDRFFFFPPRIGPYRSRWCSE